MGVRGGFVHRKDIYLKYFGEENDYSEFFGSPNLPSCGIIPLLRRHLRRPNNAGLVTVEENVHVLCDVFPSRW